MKVGLIAPASTYLSKLGASLKCSLEHGLGDIAEVVVETTNHNETAPAVRAAIQRFGLDPTVGVVVAPLNTGLLSEAQRAAAAEDLQFVALTTGEDVVVCDDEHECLFVNSFDLWQSVWLTGFFGAQGHPARVASLAALHDGGYGMLFALGLGIEAASGEVVLSAQTHVNAASDSLQPAFDMLVEQDPDVVAGLYSGREADAFVAAWQARTGDVVPNSPLLWLPPIAPASTANEATVTPFATAVGRWLPTETDAFAGWHQETLGRMPSAYSVLAFESGRLIANAVERRDDATAAGLQAALGRATCEGPRGVVAFNDYERTAGFSRYRVDVGADHQTLAYRHVATIDPPELLGEQIALARKNLKKTGWLNPYLIA